MPSDNNQARQERFLKKAREKVAQENSRTLDALRNREDYQAEYDYFLSLAEGGLTPAQTARRTGRKVVNLLCLQAPLELIHAAGLAPFKVTSGSQAAGNFIAQGLPALMCPMLRAAVGSVKMNDSPETVAWIIPTTCDWVVKFPEMLKLAGVEVTTPLHWLELPHLKGALDAQERWLDSVYALKRFLEEVSGHKISRKQLKNSITVYHQAWQALSELSEMRRSGRVAASWFFLITNVFFMDSIENWTEGVKKLLPALKSQPESKLRIFLAGSPIFFPNFKILDLLEEAGMAAVADDMCSSERLFPGAISYQDSSEFGLITALAQRYHQGCLCPTFIDNDRRINNIIRQTVGKDFGGVVFQVLKGCHSFDLESLIIEDPIKENGLKYIRLETDYAMEDSQNLLTRLEAYRQTLER